MAKKGLIAKKTAKYCFAEPKNVEIVGGVKKI